MSAMSDVQSPGDQEGRGQSTRRPRGRQTRGTAALGFLEAYALVIFIAIFIAFFSILPETAQIFPTVANFQAIAGNQAVIAIVALAALVPLIANQFDLSVGATAGLSAVYSADLMASGDSVALAVVVGIAIGALVGLINGVLVTRAGVNAVIVTLGTSTIIGGLIAMKTNGETIVNVPNGVIEFGTANTLGIPRPALVLLAIAVLVYYVLEFTPLGRYLYALGSNDAAARLVGLPTRTTLASSFVIAGVLSGSAGVLQVARSGGADPRVSTTFTLAALAAAFLSAAAIRPGRFNVGGVIVAVAFLAVLNGGLNLAGAQPYVNDYVNGAALIVGVGLAAYLGRRRRGTSTA
jgi:ribose transport system permease protein